MIAELAAIGVSPAELARKYGIPMQNIHRWNNRANLGKEANYAGASPELGVPVTDVRAMAAAYEKQISQLKKSLANMTMDRDILKDAVDIASKRKWI